MPLRRRKRLHPLIPLASMGDIAFLLIIFFMLVAKFMKNVNVQLDKAQSEDVEQVDTSNVFVTVDEDGVIRLDGIECSAAALGPGISAMIGEDRTRIVEVAIDNRLPKTSYMPVMEALAESGARVILAGEKPR